MAEDKKFKKALTSAMDGIIESSNKELYEKTQDQLEEYWHFIWDKSANIIINTYRFHDMLHLYKSFCRRWEEHHNGCCCVVERVRDKYLIPKIGKFYTTMQTLTKEELHGKTNSTQEG